MNYYYSLALTLSASLLPVITGGVKYKMVDKPGRIFYLFIIVSFLTECIASISAFEYKNNLPVYNISYIVQFGIMALYFSYNLKSWGRLKIRIAIILSSTLIGILNFIFFEPIKIFSSNYFLFQTVMVLVMGSWLIIQFLAEPYFEMHRSPHFWFVLVLMLFYSLSFFSFSLYDYLTIHLKADKSVIDSGIVVINLLTNLSFAFIFLLSPKMAPQNVG